MRTTALSLNLRSGAGLNHLSFRQLPKHTVVEILKGGNEKWAKIKLLDGTVGFVSFQYLEPIPDIENPIREFKYLESEVNLVRNISLDKPANAFTFPKEIQFDNVKDAIDFLKVETSIRYKKTPNSTWCNVYLHDLMRVLGLYIPRTWWLLTDKHSKGDFVSLSYGSNVIDITANQITEWASIFAPKFGWVLVSDKDMKNLPDGYIGAILARNPGGIGHVSAVVGKEWLQSQAGAKNKSYFTDKNWFRSTKFGTKLFMIHKLNEK
jgi:hypothetical protein